LIVYLTLIWLVNGEPDPNRSASLLPTESMSQCLDFAEGYIRDHHKTVGVDIDYICEEYKP
jgi:hypothetical protein